MYKLEYYDNKIPKDIHEEAYRYIQTLEWQSRLRHVPDASSSPLSDGYKNDLAPYVAKKTVYRTEFGHNYEVMQMHTPIGILFDHINKTLFNNKFELTGKPLGMTPESQVPVKELEDYLAEKEFKGCVAYMQAQPYETIKRTSVPNRDWDGTSLSSEGYYTLTFVANKVWSPLWHSEIFFYNDGTNDPDVAGENVTQKQNTGIGWLSDFIVNMPGRVILHDSRMLHTSKPTSVFAPELSQRISFRVTLKDGETLVQD